MVVRFSPKILGLNVEMLGLFLSSPGLNFGLLLDCVCYFYVLLLEK